MRGGVEGLRMDLANGDETFPPHPGPLPWERENRPPPSGESNALGRAGVSALNGGAHGAGGSDARLKKDA